MRTFVGCLQVEPAAGSEWKISGRVEQLLTSRARVDSSTKNPILRSYELKTNVQSAAESSDVKHDVL